MVNNTFVSNSAPSGGTGIVVQAGASVRAINTILWDTSGSEVLTGTGGTFLASYCDIHGGFTGTGNINADPLFVNFGAADTCYINHGPARDAGVASATVGGVLLTAPTTDFRGYTRQGNPDLGANEFDPKVSVENRTSVPAEFVLSQNYPNPFNPTTVISYELPVVVSMGARPMRRAIQKSIEDPLSEDLLKGRFKNAQKIRVILEAGHADVSRD